MYDDLKVPPDNGSHPSDRICYNNKYGPQEKPGPEIRPYMACAYSNDSGYCYCAGTFGSYNTFSWYI